MADPELAVATLRMAVDAVEECLDSLEAEDGKLAYAEATKLSALVTERVRRLRYKLRA